METKNGALSLASGGVKSRLEWAVGFAQAPDAEKVSRTLVEIAAFLKPVERLQPVPSSHVAEMSVADVNSLRRDVYEILSLFVGGESGSFVPPIQVEKCINRMPRGVVVLLEGHPRDLVLEMVTQLLLMVPDDTLRKCRGCERVIVKRGKRKHCTTKCQNEYNWATLSEDDKERYRRKQYEKNGWTRGARLQRFATEGETRGQKRPQVRSRTTKKAR